MHQGAFSHATAAIYCASAGNQAITGIRSVDPERHVEWGPVMCTLEVLRKIFPAKQRVRRSRFSRLAGEWRQAIGLHPVPGPGVETGCRRAAGLRAGGPLFWAVVKFAKQAGDQAASRSSIAEIAASIHSSTLSRSGGSAPRRSRCPSLDSAYSSMASCRNSASASSMSSGV